MTVKNKSSNKKDLKNLIEELEKQLSKEIKVLSKNRKSQCYSLLLNNISISPELVDKTFDRLYGDYSGCDKLDVIVDSSGGDIDAAYNLAQLFRRYGKERLTFIIPRWAKSAATLLVCAGDEILMTPIAELGPIDPQITAFNPLERRIEKFSPLHIESTLELIRQEYKNGNQQLADGLLERLQFPLTLGRFKKSLDIGVQYVEKLLSTRMLMEGSDKDKKISNIVKKLTLGYTDHGYCINHEEAKDLELNVNELTGDTLKIVWKIHCLFSQIRELTEEQDKIEMKERLKEIPPNILGFPESNNATETLNIPPNGNSGHE